MTKIGRQIAALHDPDCSVRRAAARALGCIGPAAVLAVPALADALRDPKWLVRSPGRVRHHGDSALNEIERHIARLRRPDRNVRRRAAEALGIIGPAAAPAVPALAAALRDPDWQVRGRAAKTLGEIGPAAAPAVPALVEALRDPNSDVRRDAAWALGRIGPAAGPAVPALVEALRDSHWLVRGAAEVALPRIAPAACAIMETAP